MPPLTYPRKRRLARGLLVAAVGITGALGGPVAPAGAGAPAGHTSAASKVVVSNPGSFTSTPLVTDRLGTHTGELLTLPEFRSSAADPVASKTGECDVSLRTYKEPVATRLGPAWTGLAIRTKPCTSAPSVGLYGTLGSFQVTGWTPGEFICRGRTYMYGSLVWYKTSRGYVWSGGTNKPVWDSRVC